jgi:hypothetical protein
MSYSFAFHILFRAEADTRVLKRSDSGCAKSRAPPPPHIFPGGIAVCNAGILFLTSEFFILCIITQFPVFINPPFLVVRFR